MVVSTDSEEIAGVAKKYGVDVPFLRPAALAMDNSQTIDAVIDVLDVYKRQYESTVKAFYGGDDTKSDCKFPEHDKRSSIKASLPKGKCRYSGYRCV